jgi:DNA polymerase-3 subunit alpha (Gram-positive type)
LCNTSASTKAVPNFSSVKPEIRMLVCPFPRDLLVLDLETTGADPALHSTIDIGAILLERSSLNELRSWSALIKRQENNDPEAYAMALHGRSQEELQNARDPEKAVQEFLDVFGTDYILTGWNIGFDVQFFRALLRSTGHIGAFNEIDYHRLDVWSTAQFLRSIGWLKNDISSLSSLCADLKLPRSQYHTGLEDARLTATVLRRLVEISQLALARD